MIDFKNRILLMTVVRIVQILQICASMFEVFLKQINNFKKQKMKQVLRSSIKNLREAKQKIQTTLSKLTQPLSKYAQNFPSSPLRCEVITWLYKAQASLKVSRSTLFISLCTLDKLLFKGLSITQENLELVAGTILLIATKFNEVYPVTIKKLNLLSQKKFSLEYYSEAQAAMLYNIDFTVQLDIIYQELLGHETRYGSENQQQVKQLVKTAVMNPKQTFKYGSSSLVQALKGLSPRKGLEQLSMNYNDDSFETLEIKRQLQRLHSASPKRLVEPCFA